MNNEDILLLNELKHSTEFSENYIESLLDGLIIMNLEGKIITINTELSKITGFNKGELEGVTFPFPFWPSEFYEDYKTRFNQLVTNNLNQEFKSIYIDKKGERFQAFNFLTSIKNSKGEIIAYIIIIRNDIETTTASDVASHNKHLFSVLNNRKKHVSVTKKIKKAPQLDFILNNISDGFIFLDTNWCYSYINKKAEELTGRKASTLIGKNIWEEFPKSIGNHFYVAYHKAVKTQETQFLKEYYEPLGKWFENRIHPSSQGLCIYFTDITERLEKKKVLIKNERNLDNIINNIGDPLFVKDDQSRMRIVNDAFCKMFNIQKSDVIGKTMAEELTPEESEYFLNVDKKVFRTGIEDISEESFTIQGRGKQVISTKKTRFIDENGNAFIIGIVRDITEKKKAEEKAQMLLSLIETSDEFIGLATLEGKPIYLNKMGKKMVGLELDEELPKDIKDFFPEYYHETIDNEHLVNIRKANKWNGEAIFKNFKTKDIFPIEMSGFLINDKIAANPIALGIVAKNITERKKNELQLEKNKNNLEQLVKSRTSELEKEKVKAQSADLMKSAFLATMSHELRTPMNSIIGFTGILLKEVSGPLNDEQKKQIGMVKNSGEQLLSLINDILDFSKIEAGKLNVSFQTFDYLTCLERTIQFITPQVSAKGLKISTEITEMEVLLESEERRIEQVLLNLLSNAIKFSKKGTIRIKVTIIDKRLVTQVIDQGIGISAENLTKLFQPFTQVDGILNKNLPGTGLGLTISKNLIEKLGGTIEVQSKLGKGSTFTFRVPLKHKIDT
ncbi:PAS domain-containing sensor histidine kinase [Ulvibacter litoralis]|uniref:histidine kinase n=1 Tax=Ulvibacter litoralis TaxID=227084 RepID=A0A1G7HPN2_9FLAO|nr:PAS domain-containing hybrid sensor histidine kinase/response regulator [Ulvibacter litoralis]GHC58605.1 hybrid sensor histidine kinase/response regulator [Ulvibacter litoralis]SDF02395.1 PAS domain S-box-containing protein [Ulvibacter litoralis]